jgi:GNAT superfamily N-acetyltransferase
MVIESRQDRYAENPIGIKAGLETGLSTLGEVIFDILNYGGTAIQKPDLFVKGFGNEEAAREFQKLQDIAKQEMVGDFFEVSPETAEVQQQILEPIANKVSELYTTGKYQNQGEYFSEFEALEQFASDPRVEHTIGTAELAAPAFARAGRAFMDADFKSNLAGRPGGNQVGSTRMFDPLPIYGDKKLTPESVEFNENLYGYLGEPNDDFMLERMGRETVEKKDGYELSQGEFGGWRYNKRNEDGEIVATLQGVNMPDGTPVQSNIYVRPDYRGKGLMRDLSIQARKDMPNLMSSEYKSGSARRFGGYDTPVKAPKGQQGSVSFFDDVGDNPLHDLQVALALNQFDADRGLRTEMFPGVTQRNSFTSEAKPSSAQWGFDMGYRHPIGGMTDSSTGTKLRTPIDKMSKVLSDTGTMLPEKEFDVQELVGQTIYPLFGDKSQTGVNLHAINESFFDEPVELTGGFEWWRNNPGNIWASDEGKVKTMMSRVKEAHDKGQEAYGVYLPMHVRSSNFNDMTTEAMEHGIKGLDLSTKEKGDFDESVRKKWKGWTSIDDPEMDSALKSNGNARKAFVDTIGQKRFAEKGFPSLEDAIFGVTDNRLMDVPLYHGGQHVGKSSGTTGKMGTGVYNTTIEGEAMGSMKKPVPPQLLFPDYSRDLDARGKTDQRARNRSFYLGVPSQTVTQQQADIISAFMER